MFKLILTIALLTAIATNTWSWFKAERNTIEELGCMSRAFFFTIFWC